MNNSTPTQQGLFGSNGVNLNVGVDKQDLILIGLVLFGAMTLSIVTATLITRNIK